MKKLEINCPDGHEIDLEKSNLVKGILYFKEIIKELDYNVIAKELFSFKEIYYISGNSNINKFKPVDGISSNNAKTKQQLKALLAINQLANVAMFLNNGWIPEAGKEKWFIKYTKNGKNNWEDITTQLHSSVLYSIIYFKSSRLAEKAIKILGIDLIKQSLKLQQPDNEVAQPEILSGCL